MTRLQLALLTALLSLLHACAVGLPPIDDAPDAAPAMPPPEPDLANACLIISEYIEGSGNDNKALELYNCGDRPIDLAGAALCMVSNAADECTAHALLPPRELGVAEVVTLCRVREGPAGDPLADIRARCQVELPAVLGFNGDDRLLVFYDADADGRYDRKGDRVLDAIGALDERPPDMPWADKTLRRCDFRPATGEAPYDYRSYFAIYAKDDASDYGHAPSPECL